MRTLQVTKLGSPDVLAVAEVPEPVLAPEDVMVRVEAAGVGPWDTLMRSGAFGPQNTPYVPGAELAGTVARVGDAVEGFTAGDRVWSHPGLTGATAQLIAVPAGHLGHAPRSHALGAAASAPVGVLTAAQALDALRLRPGQQLLVLAAGGNVGAYAVQLARLHGADVIAQAGIDDAARLKAAGARTVLDRHADWVTSARAAAPDGVDALLDPLGGESLAAALPLVRDGGRVATLIPRGDEAAPRGIHITAIVVRPDGLRLTRLAAAFDDGTLRTHLGPVFAMDDAAAAHRAQEQGATGKVVITVG